MNDRSLLPFLLYWCDKEYRKANPSVLLNSKKMDVERLIKTATKNKLIYLLSNNAVGQGDVWAGQFRQHLEEGAKNIALQAETLRFLNSVLGEKGIEFLVIKSYRDVDYVTVDLDIMVPEAHYQMAVDTLLANGYRNIVPKRRVPLPGFIENALSRIGGANLEADHLLEVDIYQDTSWTGMRCLDNKYIWKNPETVKMCGVECRIPNREADLLLSLAHVIFCHGTINLLDFFYMSRLLDSDLDYTSLSYESKKFGWDKSLDKIITSIRQLHHAIYVQNNTGTISFPFKMPFGIVVDAYKGVTQASRASSGSSPITWTYTALKLVTMYVYR